VLGDPVNSRDPGGLLIVPADNSGAGLLADFAASGAGARALIDYVEACSATFNVFGGLGVPEPDMCNDDPAYGQTGNGPGQSGWERGDGVDREVDVRVDADRARDLAEGIDPERFAAATLGHELIHAARFCEALTGNPFVSVLEGGGIPGIEDWYTTPFVLSELMR
jgi:hypothetical protein